MKIILVILFLGIGLQSHFAQSADPIIEIIIKEENEGTSFTGMLTNTSDQSQSFRYEFLTINRSSGGSNTNRQSGDVELDAGESAELSTARIKTTEGLLYDCKLFIYQNEKLVGSSATTNVNSDENSSGLEQSSATDPDVNLDLNLGGFVLDETRSRSGRDFYELFYQSWEAANVKGNYNIEIKEVLGKGRSTTVYVSIEDRLVFASGLEPRYDVIVDLVKSALPRALAHVERVKNYNQNLATEGAILGI